MTIKPEDELGYKITVRLKTNYPIGKDIQRDLISDLEEWLGEWLYSCIENRDDEFEVIDGYPKVQEEQTMSH